MHIAEHELRLLIDQQQNGPGDPTLEQHIQSCAECRRKFDSLSASVQNVRAHLDTLAQGGESSMPADVAVARLQTRLRSESAAGVGWRRMFALRLRVGWIAAGLALVVMLVSVSPPVQALASRFLSVFRVKQFSVVQVDPQNMQQLNQLGSSGVLAQLISDTAHLEAQGKPQDAYALAEASLLAGFDLRVPSALSETPRWRIQPAARISLQLDLPKIRAVFQALGQPDFPLPESLQGTTVTVDIPPIAAAFFGECRNAPGPAPSSLASLRSCTMLTQLLNPTITAPGELDQQQLGLALLRLLGMPEAEAVEFSRQVDWASTFVIPIPRNGTYFEEVDVDGVKGMMIGTGPKNPDLSSRYLLMWTKGEMVYALTGVGRELDALTVANSLR